MNQINPIQTNVIFSLISVVILTVMVLICLHNLSRARWWNAWKILRTGIIVFLLSGFYLVSFIKTNDHIWKEKMLRKLDESRATPINLQKMEMGIYQVNDSWLENDGRCRANLSRITAITVNKERKEVGTSTTNRLGDIVNIGDTSISSPRFYKSSSGPYSGFVLITNDASGNLVIQDWNPFTN